jgi:hypothetical protein
LLDSSGVGINLDGLNTVLHLINGICARTRSEAILIARYLHRCSTGALDGVLAQQVALSFVAFTASFWAIWAKHFGMELKNDLHLINNIYSKWRYSTAPSTSSKQAAAATTSGGTSPASSATTAAATSAAASAPSSKGPIKDLAVFSPHPLPTGMTSRSENHHG